MGKLDNQVIAESAGGYQPDEVKVLESDMYNNDAGSASSNQFELMDKVKSLRQSLVQDKTFEYKDLNNNPMEEKEPFEMQKQISENIATSLNESNISVK